MAAETEARNKELLIVSITPQNLERGNLWFKENLQQIRKARRTNPWWRDNSILLEKNLVIKPHDIIRRLMDFGYERSTASSARGVFAVRGGIIEIWPVNETEAHLIEWSGNTISGIYISVKKEPDRKPRLKAYSGIDKLTPGSYVVHVDHGIGIFRGTIKYSDQIPNSKFQIPNKFQIQNHNSKTDFENYKLEIGNSTKKGEDFFVIEYAPPTPGKMPDRLYVPTDQKNRLSPYIGFETPRIHRLGGSIWQNAKRRVKEETLKLAEELIELYKKRAAVTRHPYTGDRIMEEELHESFKYTETPDQLRAIEEIMRDLESVRPMDRVLCGDVGFGKTEVALRAAMRVITSGRQAALLSPTTVLAIQHEKTVQERIGDKFPINTALLSRLSTRSDTKKITKGLGEGSIDLVIGTHRLLSSDVAFKDLGLVIIDEEQRFGVKQKEYFKNLRSNVDILSLSATPIPRTLSLALAKLRDISRLDLPPPARLAIATYVLPYSAKTIGAAIAYELSRNGQVYFLHNRIETIGEVKEKLIKILQTKSYKLNPNIGAIHGRMNEHEIIHTMEQFRAKKIDILIATTIIENGLDISSANTLVVDDATRLGLAEAHQLRGRIGRGSSKAHAYFLFRPKHLTDRAADRLEALQEYSELGQGYEIALQDLEIRGAGNVLGREQSGAINKVGLNLYYEILNNAVHDLLK